MTLGCTVARTVVDIDPSTVSRWYLPVGAVCEPGPTPHSAAAAPPIVHAATHTTSRTTVSAAPHNVGLLPMTQGFGISPNDPIRLDLDFPMDPRNFDIDDFSDAFSLPSTGLITSGAAARHYKNDAQSLPFSLSATLGPTYIPPPSSDTFDPHHSRTDFTAATAAGQSFNPSLLSTGQKRVPPPVPDQDKRSKRRKLKRHDERGVDQQVGARQGDYRSTAIHVPPLDLPQGMSKGEYVKLLSAKIAEYS